MTKLLLSDMLRHEIKWSATFLNYFLTVLSPASHQAAAPWEDVSPPSPIPTAAPSAGVHRASFSCCGGGTATLPEGHCGPGDLGTW